MADNLEPFRDLISSAESEAEKQSVMWCVENYVPLRQLSEHNWIFCTYELFYRQTQSEADRVLQGLGLRKSWFTQRAIQKATIVTRPDSAILHEKDPLIAWRQQLSSQEIETILSTVKAFGIGLYNEDPMPNVQAVAPQSMTSVI
jgi:hypothetical protein